MTLCGALLNHSTSFLHPRRWNDCDVVISQRFAHDVLLQRDLMPQNLLQGLGHKRLCLTDVSVFHEDIQSSAKHFLHNRCIVATLEHDTHGLAFGLDVGVIFLHHADLTLATEQNERIERLFLANHLRLAALFRDTIRSLHSELNAFRNILRWEPNEDRIRVTLHNICTKLRLHDILGKQQLLTTRSRRGSCDTQTTNGRRTTACLTLHRVCDNLVRQLKAIENRLLTFVRESFRKLASFLTLLEKNVQYEWENALAERLLGRLNLRTRRTTRNHTLVILVVLTNVIDNLALRLESPQSFGGKTPTLAGNELALRSLDTLADQRVGRNVVGNHIGRLQRVEIQNTDRLIQVHVDLGLNHDRTLLRPIFGLGFSTCLRSQNLVALAGNRCDCREDLNALSTKQYKAHRDLADLCHTPSIHECIQLRHQSEHEIAVLNALPSNASTLGRTLTMQCEEFLCRDIVLRKRPLQILGSLLENILCQHELIGSHFFHDHLVSVRICCISHDLKPYLVLSTQTTSALGVDLATLDLDDLITKEHAGNTIELEALE